MYDFTDRVITYYDKQLVRRYMTLKNLMLLENTDVIYEVDKLYRELGIFSRRMYLNIARKTYQDWIKIDTNRMIDEDWIDFWLTAYDPVAKYVYENEEDRKRARLVEALMASTTRGKEIDAAMRSMSLMFRIFAVRITDEAQIQALKDNKELVVKWNAEEDDRTCGVCMNLDGNIYRITELPAKPHINCRCWVTPVGEING